MSGVAKRIKKRERNTDVPNKCLAIMLFSPYKDSGKHCPHFAEEKTRELFHRTPLMGSAAKTDTQEPVAPSPGCSFRFISAAPTLSSGQELGTQTQLESLLTAIGPGNTKVESSELIRTKH